MKRKTFFIICSVLYFIFLNSCLNNYNKVFKPKKLVYYSDIDTSVFAKNNSTHNYVYYRYINDNYLTFSHFYFLKDNFVFCDIASKLENDTILLNNSKDSIDKDVTMFNLNQKYFYENTLERWGFYRTNNDSIFIQYFVWVGPIIPSNVRISEFQGRILSDSTIAIDKEVFTRPDNGPFDFRTDISEFNPPIIFKRFKVDYIPDFKTSGIYKSLWFKKYLKLKNK